MLISGRARVDGLCRTRTAFTLAELLIVLVLGAIVLGVASSVGVRLQRHLSAESAGLTAVEQLAAGLEVLPLDLRGLSPGAGDIAPSGARDTALEIRATIASALVCAATSSTITLAFYRGPAGQALPSRAQAGDTAWVLTDPDSAERWQPVPITALRRDPGGCPRARAGADQVFDVSHLWSADVRDSVMGSPAALVRITRPERVSLYAAGDGRWYIGLRTWNTAAGQFAGIQPVSGPYRSPASTGGSRFRYFDASGAPIPSGMAGGARVARIEVALVAAQAASASSASPDSLTVAVALRNRDD